MNTTSTQSPPRILLAKEVMALLQCHRVTLRRWVLANIFPPPHQIGRQRIGWYEAEVAEWMATREIRATKRHQSAQEDI